MWSKTHSRTVLDLKPEDIYAVWSDIDRWSEWLDDVEAAALLGPFEEGSSFHFKPKGAPALNLELTEVTPGRSFTDLARLPFAQIYDTHEVISVADGVEIRSTVRISGAASLLWRKLIAEGIAENAAHQTDLLIARVKELHGAV